MEDTDMAENDIIEQTGEDKYRQFTLKIEEHLRDTLKAMQQFSEKEQQLANVNRANKMLSEVYKQYLQDKAPDNAGGGEHDLPNDYKSSKEYQQFKNEYIARQLPEKYLTDYDEVKKLATSSFQPDWLIVGFYGRLAKIGKEIYGEDIDAETLQQIANRSIDEWTKTNDKNEYPINVGLSWNKNTGIINGAEDNSYTGYTVTEAEVNTFLERYNLWKHILDNELQKDKVNVDGDDGNNDDSDTPWEDVANSDKYNISKNGNHYRIRTTDDKGNPEKPSNPDEAAVDALIEKLPQDTKVRINPEAFTAEALQLMMDKLGDRVSNPDAVKQKIAELKAAPTVTLGEIENPNPQQVEASDKQERDEVEAAANEIYRERSPYSDINEHTFDKVRLDIYKEMQLISEEEYKNVDTQNPEAVIALINKYPLSDKQQEDFEDRLAIYVSTQKINGELPFFQVMPPKVLAVAYIRLKNMQRKVQDEQQKNQLITATNRLGTHIDYLTSQSAQNGMNKINFTDVTNTADTYHGYKAMFEARYPDIKGDVGTKQLYETAAHINEAQISAYDKELHLEGITNKSAKDLEKRCDDLERAIDKIKFDDEQIAMLQRLEFPDEKGQVTPQFENGKIKRASSLETLVELAKANLLMEQLGDKSPVKEINSADLTEQVLQLAYAAHVNSVIANGAKEDPKQFTDKSFFDKFKANLENGGKLTISSTVFEATIDQAINTRIGYARRMADKLGNKGIPALDAPLVTRLTNQVSSFDKRKDDRLKARQARRQQRIENLKRMGKGLALAGGMSMALSLVGTSIAGDAGLTMATGGANKFAGMIIGTALGVGMTIHTIRKWRKQQKLAGNKHRWKTMFKDPNLMLTIASTGLGAAAAGFAITGNPGVASVLGISAMTLSGAKNAVKTYKDSRNAGLSILESGAWSLGVAGATAAGGYLGRYAAGQIIDYANDHGSNIFKHQDTTTTEEKVIKQEIQYKEGVVEHAKDILHDSWYKGHEDMLQQRVDQIMQYNADHGTDYNPYRVLLAAHDCGAIAPTDTINHVQEGPDVHTHGNHTNIFPEKGYATAEQIDAVKNLFNSDGNFNPTPEGLKAFDVIDNHISKINQTGFYEGSDKQDDGVLGYNSSGNPRVYDENGNEWSTHANGEAPKKTVEVEETIKVSKTDWFKNDKQQIMGTLGSLGNPLKRGLKARIGSLKDTIQKLKGLSPSSSDDDKIYLPINDTDKIPTNNSVEGPTASEGKINHKKNDNPNDTDEKTKIMQNMRRLIGRNNNEK